MGNCKAFLKQPKEGCSTGSLFSGSENFNIFKLDQSVLRKVVRTLVTHGDISEDIWDKFVENRLKFQDLITDLRGKSFDVYERLAEALREHDTENTWIALNYTDWDATVPHSTIIRDTYDTLITCVKRCFDRNINLTEQLLITDAISETEKNEVDAKKYTGQRAHELLSIMSRPEKTIRHFELMLDALDNHGYRGNTAFIRQLLRKPFTLSGIIQQLKTKLREFIETEYGLPRRAFAYSVLTEEQYRKLRAEKGVYDQADRLLEFMSDKFEDDCQRFLKALIDNGQQHVVNFINKHRDGNDTEIGDDLPLDEETRKMLRNKMPMLVEAIDSEDFFLTNLIKYNCIINEQKDALKSKNLSNCERSSLLIDILMRRSMASFMGFRQCLLDTNQLYALEVLDCQGAIMPVDAKLEQSNLSDLQITEEHIVREFHAILRDSEDGKLTQLSELIGKANSQGREELLAEITVRKRFSIAMNAVTELICLRRGFSIRAYFCCRTLDGLNELLNMDNLRIILECLFTYLLGQSREINIAELKWDQAEYENCKTYFASQSEQPQINNLPVELMELILVKSIVQLFVALMSTDPQPSISSLRLVCSVCRDWWYIVMDRRYNKRVICQNLSAKWCPYFKRATCYTIRQPDKQSFNGMAVCSNYIYVVRRFSDIISVYSAIIPYSMKEEAKLPSTMPVDIVSFDLKNSLFITDPYKQCVWLMEPEKSYHCTTIIKSVNAWKMFCDSNKRLLLLTTPQQVLIYSVDGKEQRRIQLPQYMDAIHSIITPDNCILVCYTSQTGSEHHQVSQVSVSGTVERVYGSVKGDDKYQLSIPSCLHQDDKGRLFVADCANNRIVLLDSRKLRHFMIVLNKEYDGIEQPCTLHYVSRDCKLFVGMKNGAIKVYNWNPSWKAKAIVAADTID